LLRNILLISLRPEATPAQVDDFLREIVAVPFAGRCNVVVGRDLGVRPGNRDLAVSNDFPDLATYTRWAEDAAHQHVRTAYLEPIAGDIARCLIEI
jgi:hypothetical protein